MTDQIGIVAGKIWDILGESDGMNVMSIPRKLGEKSAMVYQAVGWLAREGKIEYFQKEGKTMVNLTGPEQELYRSQTRIA